jgi:uncharacterized protein
MLRKDGQAGEERRSRILSLLKQNTGPVKAAEIAEITGVSRQVIVQDIALLRAKKEPILATPQGYVYLTPPQTTAVQRVIMSKHSNEATQRELNILVDHGVTVVDVGIEHSVYGRIFKNLGLKNRLDVQRFIKSMSESEASLLSSLTNGIHLHTLEAQDIGTLDQACEVLIKEGYLIQ